MAENVISKEEAISYLQAEIAALQADKAKMYSAVQYKAQDARIARLRDVIAFLETSDEPTDEAAASDSE